MGQEVAGNCVVALSVHSSVEFDDDVDSSQRQEASAVVAYAEAVLGVDFESSVELATVERFLFADVVVIETQILCPAEETLKSIQMTYKYNYKCSSHSLRSKVDEINIEDLRKQQEEEEVINCSS